MWTIPVVSCFLKCLSGRGARVACAKCEWWVAASASPSFPACEFGLSSPRRSAQSGFFGTALSILHKRGANKGAPALAGSQTLAREVGENAAREVRETEIGIRVQ